MQKKEVSIRVGFLIVLSLGLLLGVFLFLRQGFFSLQYNTYYVRFSDVTGLNLGSKVTLSGVSIGQVKEISLLTDNSIKVSIEVEKGIKIPRGSHVYLSSSLIGIGDKGIEIIPPTVIIGYIHSRETLIGTKRSAIIAAFPEAQEMISEITQTIRTIRGILTSEDTKNGMKSFFKSLNHNLNQIGLFVDTMHEVVNDNKKNVYLALEELATTMKHIKEFSGKISQAGYDQKISSLIKKTENSLDRSRELLEEMNSLVKDPQWREPFVKIMQNTEKITDSGIDIANDFKSITKKGNDMADKAINVLGKAERISDDVEDTIKDFRNKWNFFPNSSASKIKLNANVNYDFKNKRTISNVNAEIPFLGNDYSIGLYDAFEKNLFNLQMIKKVGNNKIRYGVYAGKPGLGVDLSDKSGFSLHGDVYGLNHSCFDIRASYKVSKDIAAWVSLQDLFRKNIPSIGIGILK